MSDFVDLPGASGAVYRFHRVQDLDTLPAIAGNYVYVRGSGRGLTVICAGTGDSLAKARARWPDAVAEHGAEALFIRRNVSRRSRAHEHRDIIERAGPLIDAGEDFGE
jgi:hypothetical protein